MKVIVTERIADEGIQSLKDRGFEVDTKFGISHADLVNIIDNYDAIIVRSVTKVNKELLENYEFKWVPDMKRSNYLIDMEYEPGMHYADLLRLAMKREEYALKLYNDLQTKTDNPEYVQVFKMLCQEEAKHKLSLETMYDDYMAKMGD